ncbi:MAG: hypothetical protein JRJ78_15820 [Deltaproteobacteria bacterium]|nr:hypothetical protein [Deltaproteobacteria bacterium]
MMIPVNAVQKDSNGEVVFHLAADVANDDWIRSARRLREGKDIDESPMYEDVPEG